MRGLGFVFIAAALAACSSAPAPEVASDRAVSGGAPAEPAPPALRLPGDVRPSGYALDLTIDPARERFGGRVRIDAEVVRPTGVVWLNATDLAIERATLGGAPARVIAGGEDFVGLAAERDLAPGAVVIDIAYSGRIDREKSRGIYEVDEGADGYVYTFFEPLDARRAFPCFDEPIYKVPWQLTFHVAREHVALGNAPVVSETPEADGMKRVELAPSRPLPSYLVAFVVGPFEVIDGGAAGRVPTAVRFIVPKGRAGELGYAKRVTPKVVAALEDYFGMSYPYEKLDVAVVPRYWGTMEHPGIVAMGQPLTLIRPEQETRARKEAYVNILAHELAHYWFGDYVTMAWWDDTWLNEALAQWCDMLITEAVEPDWRYRDARIDMATWAMAADETLATRAIRQPVTTRGAIEASFDAAITYAKGASVTRMFEAYAGRDRWQAFIRGYLEAHAWGNASADDFLRAMRRELGDFIADGFTSFLEQPGVPVIETAIDCAAQRITVEQARSLPAGVSDPEAKRWQVPVCVRFGDAKTADGACVELTGATGAIPLPRGCPTWLIPDADAVGYYRATIDPAMARALLSAGSREARAAKPTPGERMMVVANLVAAVARDEVSLERVLELVPLIARDPDAKVAAYALQAARVRTDGLDDETYRAYRRWWAAAFRKRARAFGWHRRAEDSDALHELRRMIAPAVARDDAALAAEAVKLAETWLSQRTGLDDDMVDGALWVAALEGDAARFERYLAAARAARDRNEQQRILKELGAFIDPTLARRALALVLDEAFDVRDTIGIVYRALYLRETRDLAIDFLAQHIDEVLARMRDDETAWFMGLVAERSCDPARRARLAAIVEPRAETFEGAQTAVKRGLEKADQCIALIARQLPALRRVLQLP